MYFLKKFKYICISLACICVVQISKYYTRSWIQKERIKFNNFVEIAPEVTKEYTFQKHKSDSLYQSEVEAMNLLKRDFESTFL